MESLKAGKRQKYGARPTTLDGARFHSKGEAQRWAELQVLERVGKIMNLERQVPFPLVVNGRPLLTPKGRPMKAVIDFTYFDVAANEDVIEDFKGYQTAESRLKLALLAAITGRTIRITGAKSAR